MTNLKHYDASTKPRIKPHRTTKPSTENSRISDPEATFTDRETPYHQLLMRIKHAYQQPKAGNAVYWMRMHDLRIEDNRALEAASQFAAKFNKALIVLHILSPQDYQLHDRSARRIDFCLRQLEYLKSELLEFNIPLFVKEINYRSEIPRYVAEFCKSVDASLLTANIEYEVDELRRDIQVYNLFNGDCCFKCFQDILAVPPGDIMSQSARPYTVFSPFARAWAKFLQSKPEFLRKSESLKRNSQEAVENSQIKELFDSMVPKSVDGFECADQKLMKQLYPVGKEVATSILDEFLYAKPSKQLDVPPLKKPIKEGFKELTRAKRYATDRNRPDLDNTSRLSPYLATGMISIRECLDKIKSFTKGHIVADRSSSYAIWTNELAWRDFYAHILAHFPRVCMRKPFNLKYTNIEWEHDADTFEAWKQGRTGFPIVDAAMRQLNTIGYMHNRYKETILSNNNRCRMIVAMFLTKDLMIDWREGEKYFMKQLIDGDFASNNGGWQWSSSTGCDPQPYFRIFNPLLQSVKSDLSGDYIRKCKALEKCANFKGVPELKKLDNSEIHEPYSKLGRKDFEKLDYPKPIVDHSFARNRALERFKAI